MGGRDGGRNMKEESRWRMEDREAQSTAERWRGMVKLENRVPLLPSGYLERTW